MVCYFRKHSECQRKCCRTAVPQLSTVPDLDDAAFEYDDDPARCTREIEIISTWHYPDCWIRLPSPSAEGIFFPGFDSVWFLSLRLYLKLGVWKSSLRSSAVGNENQRCLCIHFWRGAHNVGQGCVKQRHISKTGCSYWAVVRVSWVITEWNKTGNLIIRDK